MKMQQNYYNGYHLVRDKGGFLLSFTIVFIWLLSCLSAIAAMDPQGPKIVVDPKAYPFMDTELGRDGIKYADHRMNKNRLYDFYRRQAEFYLDGNPVPEILHPYPGLDAGKFGHWGESEMLDMESNRWNEMDLGSVVGAIYKRKKTIAKAISVHVGGSSSFSVCFDPVTLSIRDYWKGGFVKHATPRWGLIQGVTPDGESLLQRSAVVGWSRKLDAKWEKTFDKEYAEYFGYYRFGRRVAFSYRIGESNVLDSLDVIPAEDILTRTLEFENGINSQHLYLLDIDKGEVSIEESDGQSYAIVSQGKRRAVIALQVEGGNAVLLKKGVNKLFVKINKIEKKGKLRLYHAFGFDSFDPLKFLSAVRMDEGFESLTDFKKGGPSQWIETVTVKGKLGEEDGPYVIDTIPVPYENPYRSMFFLAGQDFFENGDAAVCSIMGDVWRVSGISEGLESLVWKRYAVGLNQPLGLVMVDNKPYIIGRDQITVLHDLNNDGEADFYQCFTNDYPSSSGHNYITGLQRDAAGNFYFSTRHAGVCKVSPDGKQWESLANGLRNPNGIGVSKGGIVLTSQQEGTWAPSSMVIEVEKDAFYGYPTKSKVKIDPPLCFVPRGVDPSTGGQVFVYSDKWGPLENQILSFSFGNCSHYMVLRDVVDGRPQGAAVPLPGQFWSGAHRGRFNPHDGQLYVTGCHGWGTYSKADSCFERVRYTGKKVYLPTGFHAHQDGIIVNFAEPLDKASVEDSRNYFCQQWSYVYSKGYGSAEFSIKQPDKVGHDRVPVASVELLEDGKSIFLHMPEIIPAMQMHVYGRMKAADGKSFALDIYPTLHRLDKPFKKQEMKMAGHGHQGHMMKPTRLKLRIKYPDFKSDEDDKNVKKGRPIMVKTITGLKYDKETFTVKAGERISLTLKNVDLMPHNFVLAKPGSLEKVGLAADAMMTSDPHAVDKEYVPNVDEVLNHTSVIFPEESHTIHFNAPKKAGEYPYLCTFPGHWRVMNGKMIVEEK